MGLFTSKEDEAGAKDAGSKRGRVTRRAARSDAALDPLDPLELAKRRARRRLIGAAALVLGAVVLLPMVFDKEPKNRPDDLSVDIPSQNSSFNPPLAASASSSVVVPAPLALPTQSSLVPGAPAPTGEVQSQPGAATTAAPPASSPASPARSMPSVALPPAPLGKNSESKSDTKSESKPVTLKTAGGKDAPGRDDPRALAALEGKSLAPTSTSEKTGDSFAVQIGAYANADKVKEVRERLSAAGLKPYTENLSTAQGPRTRVRVGPFASHEAAQEARDKVKGLGFDGSVVTL